MECSRFSVHDRHLRRRLQGIGNSPSSLPKCLDPWGKCVQLKSDINSIHDVSVDPDIVTNYSWYIGDPNKLSSLLHFFHNAMVTNILLTSFK